MRLFALLPCLAACFALNVSASEPQAPTLDIYWIDSEGGGSTLIVTPAGESLLVDTGNPGGRDAGRIHQVATQQAGLKRIDHVVITHFHGDHFGGLADLAQLMPVGTLYDKGITEAVPDQGGNQLRWTMLSRPYRDAKVEQRVTLAAGDEVKLKQVEGLPSLSLRCLAANQKFISPDAGHPLNSLTSDAPDKAPDPSDNANSVVLLLAFGGFRFFDGGDLTWNVEKKLVSPHQLAGEVDVYQVNHHGLDSSSHPLMVRSLAPTVAVFNNGPRKGTSQSAMDALKAVPGLQAIYQVHENVREDRHNNTAPEMIANHGDLGDGCAGHHLKCSVSADAKTYTLFVPSRGHERVYQTRPK